MIFKIGENNVFFGKFYTTVLSGRDLLFVTVVITLTVVSL